MAKNNQWKNLGGLVFSTNPDYKPEEEDQEDLEPLDPIITKAQSFVRPQTA